jgi:cellulose synthase/poly-beta-1,6-N-acetylglucosamine synthase-like glycosyltransferase
MAEGMIWSFKTLDGFVLAAPIFKVLLILLILCWDYPLLLVYRCYQHMLNQRRTDRDKNAKALPVLVVIPSLMRVRDELTSMQSTVRSVIDNGYPGELTVVLTIDGTQDAPKLYAELCAWVATQSLALSPGQHLYVTGTAQRRSKPMAIDHAIHFVKGLVARHMLPAFPPVYVSTDADADLGPHALRRIVARLQRRNRITGWPARVVAGALHVRGNAFWQGFRHFFTVQGQLNLQVAREYYVGNIWRYNIRWLPVTGVPGAFYCTWSEIFINIPNFMGYMRTLKPEHWHAWWLGKGAPNFSDYHGAPLPELVAGDTDDTVTAYFASIARYQDGRFNFDPPRTPLHALWFMLRSLFVDRPLQFEPEAHVFTSSPTTPRSLFKQRKRWNSSRVELTGRFWPALRYHWSLGLPVMCVKMLIARGLLVGIAAYVLVPTMLWNSFALTAFILGYLGNITSFTAMTLFALLINRDFRYWRLLLALPFAPAYQFFFNWIPGAVGVISDVFLFGNRTGFAPESTLRKGNSARLAFLFRLRRACALTIRSFAKGDVPFGRFWFGWRETQWTDSGFAGWNNGRKRRIVPPLREWFR